LDGNRDNHIFKTVSSGMNARVSLLEE